MVKLALCEYDTLYGYKAELNLSVNPIPWNHVSLLKLLNCAVVVAIVTTRNNLNNDIISMELKFPSVMQQTYGCFCLPCFCKELKQAKLTYGGRKI